MKKIMFICLLFLSVFTVRVDAKELDIYFYPNGGSVATNNFNVTNSYDDINYDNTDYYAKYTDKSTINNINSIAGKKFSLKRSGTSQVNGREWYFYNYADGKYYYFSESKKYKVSSVLEQLGVYDSFYSIDLYANWESNKKTGGIDIKEITDDINNHFKLGVETPKCPFYTARMVSDVKVGDTITFNSETAARQSITVPFIFKNIKLSAL